MLVNPPMVLGLIVNHLGDRMRRGIKSDFIIGCKAVGAKPYFQGFHLKRLSLSFLYDSSYILHFTFVSYTMCGQKEVNCWGVAISITKL